MRLQDTKPFTSTASEIDKRMFRRNDRRESGHVGRLSFRDEVTCSTEMVLESHVEGIVDEGLSSRLRIPRRGINGGGEFADGC